MLFINQEVEAPGVPAEGTPDEVKPEEEEVIEAPPEGDGVSV